MSTRTKEEIQEIWAATNAPHTKSNKPPRLTKKEKKLIGVGKDEGRAVLKYARIYDVEARNYEIFKKTVIGLAPSIAAASYKSLGTVLSAPIKIRKQNGMDPHISIKIIANFAGISVVVQFILSIPRRLRTLFITP